MSGARLIGVLTGSFGIGTSLSNDFKKASSGGAEKSRALNMVIKLSSVGGKPTVKISDELTKVRGRTPLFALHETDRLCV